MVSLDYAGRVGSKTHELSNRLAGLALRSDLEQLAELDKRDDERGGLEVDVLAETHASDAEREGHDNGVGERNGRSQRDQHVHVRRSVAQ